MSRLAVGPEYALTRTVYGADVLEYAKLSASAGSSAPVCDPSLRATTVLFLL
jgi:hypothetical protein